MPTLLDVMNFIGTIAFAIAGALVAVRHEMDVFGVNILAVITATGGGMIRDIIMGEIPPAMFRDPFYVLVSVCAANIVFFYLFYRKRLPESVAHVYEKALFLSDTLGLAAFTVGSTLKGFRDDPDNPLFFIVFLGVVTGVGGGLLRDICANTIPRIFVKRVYAVASILGALVTGCMLKFLHIGDTIPALAGASVVVILRLLASHYRWNLPRIRSGESA